jgi:hypothetical protein
MAIPPVDDGVRRGAAVPAYGYASWRVPYCLCRVTYGYALSLDVCLP